MSLKRCRQIASASQWLPQPGKRSPHPRQGGDLLLLPPLPKPAFNRIRLDVTAHGEPVEFMAGIVVYELWHIREKERFAVDLNHAESPRDYQPSAPTEFLMICINDA